MDPQGGRAPWWKWHGPTMRQGIMVEAHEPTMRQGIMVEAHREAKLLPSWQPERRKKNKGLGSSNPFWGTGPVT